MHFSPVLGLVIFLKLLTSDMADLLRDNRRLCDHAHVNLDFKSNDVYKSGKVLFALCRCEIINSALILTLFLLIIRNLFLDR